MGILFKVIKGMGDIIIIIIIIIINNNNNNKYTIIK